MSVRSWLTVVQTTALSSPVTADPVSPPPPAVSPPKAFKRPPALEAKAPPSATVAAPPLTIPAATAATPPTATPILDAIFAPDILELQYGDCMAILAEAVKSFLPPVPDFLT